MSLLQEYLPEERNRYPEHISHNPFDQPDSPVEMGLYLCSKTIRWQKLNSEDCIDQ
jgi:hypothetical protein